MKEEIRSAIKGAGAIAVGFAGAGEVDPVVSEGFADWIKKGKHAGMDYLRRHVTLRNHTDNVLKGSATVISMAFSFTPERHRSRELPVIACYAYGTDYHDVIKKRLEPVVDALKTKYGGDWRICVDSAPLEERYWAVKSGIGRKGKNGCVIIRGAGSYCFLAEILTTIKIDPDKPGNESCYGCNVCIERCPTGALGDDATIDTRKCLSYLTIEKKGEFTEEEKKIITEGESSGYLFGCDNCLRFCPINQGLSPTEISEFRPIKEMMEIKGSELMEMDETTFKRIFRNSPIKRARLEGLKRNLRCGREIVENEAKKDEPK